MESPEGRKGREAKVRSSSTTSLKAFMVNGPPWES